MDEDRFWSMIEAAWGPAGGKVKTRQRLAEGRSRRKAHTRCKRWWTGKSSLPYRSN
jgi:hypothetical protein